MEEILTNNTPYGGDTEALLTTMDTYTDLTSKNAGDQTFKARIDGLKKQANDIVEIKQQLAKIQPSEKENQSRRNRIIHTKGLVLATMQKGTHQSKQNALQTSLNETKQMVQTLETLKTSDDKGA